MFRHHSVYVKTSPLIAALLVIMVECLSWVILLTYGTVDHREARIGHRAYPSQNLDGSDSLPDWKLLVSFSRSLSSPKRLLNTC